MTKRMFFSAALLLVLCACSGGTSTPPENSTAEPPLASVSDDAPSPVVYNGVTLDFIPPDKAYDVLGITAFRDGCAVIYQQEMPDSFNKLYSRDDVFYNISTQLFAADGTYIETVDSQWHNAIKITEPLLRLTPNAESITFEVWRENETGQTEAGCFTLAITEEGLKALGENLNHDLYEYHLFSELAADGGTQLQYSVEYDDARGRDMLHFRLAGREGAVIEQMVSVVDASFSNALYNTAHGINETDWLNDQQNPLYILDVALDAQVKTARLSNGKITCDLNFGGESPNYSVSRSYTEGMLDKQVAVSPDGTRCLYTADARNYFESSGGCDYVVREPEGIVFLYAGYELDQVCFLDDKRIFANTFGALRFYDAATGAVLSPGPQFDFGVRQNPYNKSQSGIAHLVVGSAVDEQNHVLLIAHRPYTFGSGVLWQGTPQQTQALPVTLTVLNWAGEPLRDYDTGMTMRAFAKFSINILSIELDDDGTADLFWGNDDHVRVDYMPHVAPVRDSGPYDSGVSG